MLEAQSCFQGVVPAGGGVVNEKVEVRMEPFGEQRSWRVVS